MASAVGFLHEPMENGTSSQTLHYIGAIWLKGVRSIANTKLILRCLGRLGESLLVG